MQHDDTNDILNTAKEHFTKGHYKLAEPLLLQLHSEALPKADVPYMLGTIAFDRGQLKKAIQLFKQSLEINPEFTDAAVGLSIILNDLGRYEEAKKVFDDAYTAMKRRQNKGVGKDETLNEKLALRHAELGDMYFLNSMYDEAEVEFAKAVKLNPAVKTYMQKLEETQLKTHKAADELSAALGKSLNEDYFRDLSF